jgi:hypothetical protein
MKKFGSLALAALIVTALSVPATAASTYEAAAGTPTIDGKKDNVYAAKGIAINLTEKEGTVATTGATGTAYTAWDNDYLYVFVEVTDAAVTAKDKVTSIWANDSVEIYINLEGKEGNIADINAAQYTYGPSFTKFAGGGKHNTENNANAKSAFTYTDKGYTIEVAIPWGKNYTPKADAVIPFALGINDDADADPATRENHVFSGKNLGSAWQTADSNWDNLKLTTIKYTPPATNTGSPKTADMGIVAALSALAASGAAVLSLKKRK